MAIYTIGFTKKTAEKFFETIKDAKIDVVIDIRLNNTSQLASFAKFPDIQYFLKQLSNCGYIHDLKFAPGESTLKDYKSKKINWSGYVEQFEQTMQSRKIYEYIQKKYLNYKDKNICLLCSEANHIECHRSLVSEYFKKVFNANVINL